ncbi:heavy-metal-associated domain-containing protein [Kribbella solani]|uniref:Copper chaperone CopZ n=1 Tax=Kribbella solani TaxID=236067 RepID=A0A841DXN4_9ACTN|nr:heavy metal-associated domain-containing protein [Kribbella solani]MBB5981530.1 copper chaperone CopZ [Kribbella solani]MDX2972441.1 heavy metal-associated domain-containing protein [Kribbella solani]
MTTETKTFHVLGMTCAHCVRFITEELQTVPGITTIAIDLPTGKLTITTDRPITPTKIQTAVEAAGYTLKAPGSAPAHAV